MNAPIGLDKPCLTEKERKEWRREVGGEGSSVPQVFNFLILMNYVVSGESLNLKTIETTIIKEIIYS